MGRGLIEDTRQKIGEHETKNEWWAAQGISVTRCRLPFGDYCYVPSVVVDTKKDIAEIAQNMCGKEHSRFREECKFARDYGSKLVILVENEDGVKCVDDVGQWINPRRFISPNCVDGHRLMLAMKTMSERYGVEFRFCTPEESAGMVLKILEGQ